MKKHPLVKWLKNLSAIKQSVVFYLFAVVCDYVSTVMCLRANPNAGETNPFARDANMGFVMHHALVDDALYLAMLGVAALVVWHIARQWSARIANTVVAGYFVWVGFDRLTTAVYSNTLMALHFYVPTPIDPFEMIARFLR